MKKIILIIAVFIGLYSCTQEDYLVDGGVSDNNVNMTTFDFLKSHYQLDSLAILIEKAGLVQEVNGSTTLFAPNNQSINNYVKKVLSKMRELDPKAEFSFKDIPMDTIKKYMGGYIFNEKLRRENLTKEGKVYTAINGEIRRISLEPVIESYKDFLTIPPAYVYFTYKNGDSWDDPDQIVDDKKIVVRTSNLISTNGVIHVLQGDHVLFNYDPEN